jgi:hypothetical protein
MNGWVSRIGSFRVIRPRAARTLVPSSYPDCPLPDAGPRSRSATGTRAPGRGTIGSRRPPDARPPQEETDMTKSHDQKKDKKKPAQKSAKEKRQEKREKKRQ